MTENGVTLVARAHAILGAIQAYMPQRGENSIWDDAEDVIGELAMEVERLSVAIIAIREWRSTAGAVGALGQIPSDASAKDNWNLDVTLQGLEGVSS